MKQSLSKRLPTWYDFSHCNVRGMSHMQHKKISSIAPALCRERECKYIFSENDAGSLQLVGGARVRCTEKRCKIMLYSLWKISTGSCCISKSFVVYKKSALRYLRFLAGTSSPCQGVWRPIPWCRANCGRDPQEPSAADAHPWRWELS